MSDLPFNRFVQFSKTGSYDVLEVQSEAIPTPKEDEIVVQNLAIGFNFIDTYFRRGLYPVNLPFRGGSEGAGFVHAVGPNVTKFKKGDRVAYLSSGSYADYVVVSVKSAGKIPPEISFEVAAASTLKGLTVQYLLGPLYTPKSGEIVLLHAGAGGLGLIFLQWAQSLGVKVITTVSNDEKAATAKEFGAWHVLKYTDDIPARVKELTDGKQVKVVYDSVGKDTFETSLACLAPRGLFVSFGNASGPPPPVEPQLLSQNGSLFFTRPKLNDYLENFQEQLDEFLHLVTEGDIEIRVDKRYALVDIASVHRDAEHRKNRGSIVIIP